MGRLIKYWIALGAVAAVTSYGTVFLVFGGIDLSFLEFATVLCASLLQAAVFVWRSEQPSDALALAARSVLRHPLAQPVLVLDGLVLGAGIVWWDAHVIGLGAEVSIHGTWTLVKATVAVAFFARALQRSGGHRATTAWHVSAPLLLVFALEPSTSWLAATFTHLNDVLGPRAEVLQRLALYGAVFSILIIWVLRSSRAVATRSRAAGALLQASVAAAIVLAVAVVLATFNLPVLTQPWLGAAQLSASTAATCVLLAAIFLATVER